jgi:hypothetical protein
MGSISAFQFAAFGDTLLPAAADAAAAQASLLAEHPQTQWTPEDVRALMAHGFAPPSGRPGDQAQARQHLSAAFLAGVVAAHEAAHGKVPGALAARAVAEARTLLKNRAASAQTRQWKAFSAGLRAGRPAAAGAGMVPPAVMHGAAERPLKLFVRQPFTESGDAQQALIGDVLAQIEACSPAAGRFAYLTGRQAESAATFRTSFEAETGQAFTPAAFRAHRLQLLAQADAFINIRVGMSESSAFELSYHVFRGACTPVLFLVWKHAPIKTTLLKDLHELCEVTYLEFERPQELRDGMAAFFERLARGAARRRDAA